MRLKNYLSPVFVVTAFLLGAASAAPAQAAPVTGDYSCAARDIPGITGTLSLTIADVAPVKPGDQIQLSPAAGTFSVPANSIPAARGWTSANVYTNPGLEVDGAAVTHADALQAKTPITQGGVNYAGTFSFAPFSFDGPGSKQLKLPASFPVNITFYTDASVPTNEFFTCSNAAPATVQTITVLGATESPSSGQPSQTVTPSAQGASSSQVAGPPAKNQGGAAQDLANTGFTALWLGIAGALVLVGGIAAVVFSRRRTSRANRH